MISVDTLDEIAAAGIEVQLTDRGTIKLKGNDCAINTWAPILKAHKQEVIGLLQKWQQLVLAIENCCRIRGDNGKNLAALIRDCRQFPPEDWTSLTRYFEGESARWTH